MRTSPEGPAGVVYAGDKAFRYKDIKSGKWQTVTPGERVSRRQYENVRFQANGWESKAEYERIARAKRPLRMYDQGRHVHEADAYRTWARIYSEEHATPVPKGPDNEYSRAFAAALHDKFRDTSPDSPFAKLLVIVGIRDESWQWDVGDTPSSK